VKIIITTHETKQKFMLLLHLPHLKTYSLSENNWHREYKLILDGGETNINGGFSCYCLVHKV